MIPLHMLSAHVLTYFFLIVSYVVSPMPSNGIPPKVPFVSSCR
jgi:hypothetical protein